MKQKRLNGHKLSKVEPPIKAKWTSEKKTETERKIDILLHTILYPQIWKSSNGSDISDPAIGVKEQVVNKLISIANIFLEFPFLELEYFKHGWNDIAS